MKMRCLYMGILLAIFLSESFGRRLRIPSNFHLRKPGNDGKMDWGPSPKEHFMFLLKRFKLKQEYAPAIAKLRHDWYDETEPHVNIQRKLTQRDRNFFNQLCQRRRRRQGRKLGRGRKIGQGRRRKLNRLLGRNRGRGRGQGRSRLLQGNREKRQEPTTMTVRKEYRMLTDSERTAYHNAVLGLKNKTIDGIPEYDIIAGQHESNVAKGAHFGPGFSMWHRKFLIVFENALKSIDPDVSSPYWDSSCDESIGASFGDSAMFTADGIGNWDGVVTTGPFANFSVLEGCRNIGETLTRGVGQDNLLYNYAELRAAENNYTNFGDFMRDNDPNQGGWQSAFETSHGLIHVTTGGHMGSLSCSPNDPAFFLHHTFVDNLFERMILILKNEYNITSFDEANYDNTITEHRLDDEAEPLNTTFRNLFKIDYLSTNNIEYAPSPCLFSCTNDADCGNGMLYCSTTLGRCSAKVREGAVPVNNTESSCYCSGALFNHISNGRCACSATPPPTTQPGTETTTPAAPTTTVDLEDAFNNDYYNYYNYADNMYDFDYTWNTFMNGK